jgi:hypothetical protein
MGGLDNGGLDNKGLLDVYTMEGLDNEGSTDTERHLCGRKQTSCYSQLAVFINYRMFAYTCGAHSKPLKMFGQTS